MAFKEYFKEYMDEYNLNNIDELIVNLSSLLCEGDIKKFKSTYLRKDQELTRIINGNDEPTIDLITALEETDDMKILLIKREVLKLLILFGFTNEYINVIENFKEFQMHSDFYIDEETLFTKAVSSLYKEKSIEKKDNVTIITFHGIYKRYNLLLDSNEFCGNGDILLNYSKIDTSIKIRKRLIEDRKNTLQMYINKRAYLDMIVSQKNIQKLNAELQNKLSDSNQNFQKQVSKTNTITQVVAIFIAFLNLIVAFYAIHH